MNDRAGRRSAPRDRRWHRLVLVIAAVAMVCGWPSSVYAHIDPEPAEAPAGSEQVVGFTVEHGCDGSPTVQLDMRLPAGVTTPLPEATDGWTTSVDGDVVTFVGGPLPDDTPQTFRIRMTLPVEPGATLYFPFVQRCEVGEIRWIDIPSDGSGAELDEPAPAMVLTEPVATPSTSSPASTTSASPNSTIASTTSVSTTVPSTVAPTADDEVTPTTEAPADETTPPVVSAPETNGDASGGGSGGVWILIGSIVGVAVIGALALRQSRRARGQGRR